jgi:hypothetical protein
MSYIGSQVKMLFGGPGDDLARASAGSNHQLIPESIVATTGRAFVGPEDGNSNAVSVHVIVGAGSAPVGTLTLWESNLPNPDPNNDAHWVLNAGFTSIDLSVVANTFRTVVTSANLVRLKATRTSGTLSLIVWVKGPGA